jgi:hypothetical protein
MEAICNQTEKRVNILKCDSDADSPKGPFAPGGDRDFNGVYDGY